MPNHYMLESFVEMLEFLPLVDPDSYAFDFDLSMTWMSATAQFKRRGCVRDEWNRPIKVFAKIKTTGVYVRKVEISKDAQKAVIYR